MLILTNQGGHVGWWSG